MKQLQNYELALSIASANGFPGAEDICVGRFQQLMAEGIPIPHPPGFSDLHLTKGKYAEAARLAASSPKGILRTTDTISQFQRLQQAGAPGAPLQQYFSALLEQEGKLNKVETRSSRCVHVCRNLLKKTQ